jgi:hypothetical protein
LGSTKEEIVAEFSHRTRRRKEERIPFMKNPLPLILYVVYPSCLYVGLLSHPVPIESSSNPHTSTQPSPNPLSHMVYEIVLPFHPLPITTSNPQPHCLSAPFLLSFPIAYAFPRKFSKRMRRSWCRICEFIQILALFPITTVFINFYST